MKLGLDCSQKNIFLGLLDINNKVIDEYYLETRDQAEQLLKIIDGFLKKNHCGLDDINELIFSNGPGSFTALRIGLATLLGLFSSQNKKVTTLSSLYLRCLTTWIDNKQLSNTSYLVLLKASRQRVYFGCFDGDSESFYEELLPIVEANEKIKSLKSKNKLILSDLDKEIGEFENISNIKQLAGEQSVSALALRKAMENRQYLEESSIHEVQLSYLQAPDTGKN